MRKDNRVGEGVQTRVNRKSIMSKDECKVNVYKTGFILVQTKIPHGNIALFAWILYLTILLMVLVQCQSHHDNPSSHFTLLYYRIAAIINTFVFKGIIENVCGMFAK